MPNGYFDLSGFDQLGGDDILKTNLNESGEFAPQSVAQTGADNNIPDPKAPVPAPASATLEDGEKGPKPPQTTAMPGETQVKKDPAAGHEMGPKIPQGTEISLEDWKASMRALQQSFKEGVELMQMLESCKIVEKTAEQRQQEYMEEVMLETMMAAWEDGPMFEAVKKEDKGDIKKIVRALRPKVKEGCKGDGIYFYDAKIATRTISAAITAAAGLGATAIGYAMGPITGLIAGGVAQGAATSGLAAMVQQVWTTRLWQVIGVLHLESGNIQTYMKELNEKYKEELGEYKLIHYKAHPTIIDCFKSKFDWKGAKNAYFILVDKKLPSEVKEALDAMDQSLKKAEEAKEKGKDGVKTESGCTCGECDECKKKAEEEKKKESDKGSDEKDD